MISFRNSTISESGKTAAAAGAVKNSDAAKSRKEAEKTLQDNVFGGNKYQDPLHKWPMKGCAYSNEIGAAISDVSPKLGTLLWVPALMYFGADIYDKYKNDKTNYDPSAKRGVKEAAFQALASVVLPTMAVKAGQKAASSLDRFTKSGLSSQAKEDILSSSLEFTKSNGMHSFENNPKSFADSLKNTVLKKASGARSDYKALPLWKKALSFINPLSDFDTIAHADIKKTGAFAEQQGLKLMEMRAQLMQDKKPAEMSKKLFAKFQANKYSYNNAGDAAKACLQEFTQKQIFKNKMLKTAGGFIGLALLMKPIDNFVENIVIKKTVEPGLDYISDNYPVYSDKIGSRLEALMQRGNRKQPSETDNIEEEIHQQPEDADTEELIAV